LQGQAKAQEFVVTAQGAGRQNSDSPLAPFRETAFAIVWTATVVSNVGNWMYNAASGWLMTSLSPSALIVSLVQVASALPIFLFALPAGALADIVDRRQFLIAVQVATTLVSAIFALLVGLKVVNPALLLLFTFFIGVGAALTAPPWQSIVPELVPKQNLQAAITLNSVGINISRAIGPALGGIVIGAFGVVMPFWLAAVSNVAAIAALVWWRSPKTTERVLPPEHLIGAMVAGTRYARFNPQLRATILRATGFFLFASSYWALLPLVARHQLTGGPALYGYLLGAIGLGAVTGAVLLPKLKALLGPDRLLTTGTVGTAIALCTFAFGSTVPAAFGASLLAGASWIAALSTLNVSTQLSLPNWVRGRGLALFATVYFGGMTIGSLLWGGLADRIGVPYALVTAAAGAVCFVPIGTRWRLIGRPDIDLSPSLHWAAPVIAEEIPNEQGPVLVATEYQVAPSDREAFLSAVNKLGMQRRRDGAYAWQIFQDASQVDRYVEMFWVSSWVEHMRQHERVTKSDRILQEHVQGFHKDGKPKVSHMVGVRRS
jgi:MFS family permease